MKKKIIVDKILGMYLIILGVAGLFFKIVYLIGGDVSPSNDFEQLNHLMSTVNICLLGICFLSIKATKNSSSFSRFKI